MAHSERALLGTATMMVCQDSVQAPAPQYQGRNSVGVEMKQTLQHPIPPTTKAPLQVTRVQQGFSAPLPIQHCISLQRQPSSPKAAIHYSV